MCAFNDDHREETPLANSCNSGLWFCDGNLQPTALRNCCTS
jgi:hypothetical protein